MLHPVEVDRDTNDSVGIVTGQVCFDEMIAHFRCLVGSATRLNEDVGNKLLQRSGA